MSRQLRYTPTRGQAGDPSDKVATPDQVLQLVMREAQRRGIKNFQPHMAAGIVGSLMQESGNFRRDVIEQKLRGDDGTAYGAAQWRGDRKSNLDKFLNQRGLPASSLEGQIAFAFEEMDSSSPFRDFGAVKALKGMLNSKNVAQAASEFIHFERPAGYGKNKRNPALSAYDRNKRIGHATTAFSSFAGAGRALNQQPQEQAQAQPMNKVKFEYGNSNATRNKPLQKNLENAIQAAAGLTGGISRVVVFSGGQDTRGRGSRRTGSPRHDGGNAADVYLYDDKNQLIRPDNPKHQAVLAKMVANSKQQGITGIGAGEGYMGGKALHLGYGTSAVWGKGGKSKNAPDWLKAAYNGVSGNTSNKNVANTEDYGYSGSGPTSNTSSEQMSSAKQMLNQGGANLFNKPKLSLQFGDVSTADLQSDLGVTEPQYQDTSEGFVQNMQAYENLDKQIYNNLGYYG